MKKMFRNFKRSIGTIYAQYFILKMQKEIRSKNDYQFWSLYEQASKLNAYFIVFENIYLD